MRLEWRPYWGTLLLPLIADMVIEVSPRHDSALMRLMFAMADARLNMWDGNNHPDLTEEDTKQLSSSWRGKHVFEGTLMVHDWVKSKRDGWPESL